MWAPNHRMEPLLSGEESEKYFHQKLNSRTLTFRQKMSTSTSNEVDQVQSVAMIRNLMRVTFSNVVYTRGIFDPSQFKSMNARQLLS